MAEAGESTASGHPTPAVPRWAAPLVASTARHWRELVLGLGLAGGALLSLAWLGPLPRTGLAGFLGCYLLLYATLVTLQSGQVDWIGPRLRRRLGKAVISSGVGFYGCMTLARFLQLELHTVVQNLREFEFTRTQFAGMAMEWIKGFSVDSLRNTIESFLWPARLIGTHGIALAGLIAVGAWLLYALGSRAFPALHRALEAKDTPAAGTR